MQGARYQHCNGDARMFETRQRRAGCGVCTQETRDATGPADLRWRASSPTDCPSLLEAASGLRPLDASFACRQSCGAQDRSHDAFQYGRPRVKKNDIKPHLKEYWVIPPKASAAFVAAMEDVLEVYTRPHDPARPLLCLDETSKQLVAKTRTPLPAQPGRPARYDYEYQRNGTASLFMLFAPLEGWRDVKVTERRTAVDYAQVLKELSDVHFAHAKKIVLVQDNLNTHSAASLYEAFTASEARRLVERFEWHYTPKHGSWLNMAESELAALSSQCLDRRLADQPTLEREVEAWVVRRNTHNVKADWRFTEADARIKLKSLYPAL